MARIDSLGNFLTDVAEAIRTKKGTTDTIQASNFDTEIASIEGASKYAPRHISFYGYTGTDLTEETANLDTSNITSMRDMFRGCNKLVSVDLSSFNTSNVTNMRDMFYSCGSLTKLDLSSFNVSNVTDMLTMFSGCSNLTELNLSDFNTEKVTTMNQMFYACMSLSKLDLSSFNTSNVTNMSSMFRSCTNLKKLDIRNFDFSKVTSYTSMFSSVPTGCEIIVKDDTAKTWITSKFTTLTNVKTVAELEVSA